MPAAPQHDISWAPPHAPPGTFQNHILYDLVAAYLLGGNIAQMNAVVSYHEKTNLLQPSIDPLGIINGSNWESHVGMAGQNPSPHNSEYLFFFRKQLAVFGANRTLGTYLPTLLDGVFGKLYHGLQALGWGYMETGIDDMVAQGLAWMATGSEPPASLAAKPTATNLTSVLVDMHADPRLPKFTGDPTFSYYVRSRIYADNEKSCSLDPAHLLVVPATSIHVVASRVVLYHTPWSASHMLTPTTFDAPPMRAQVFLAELVANHSDVLREYDLLVSSEVSLAESIAITVEMSDAAFLVRS